MLMCNLASHWFMDSLGSVSCYILKMTVDTVLRFPQFIRMCRKTCADIHVQGVQTYQYDMQLLLLQRGWPNGAARKRWLSHAQLPQTTHGIVGPNNMFCSSYNMLGLRVHEMLNSNCTQGSGQQYGSREAFNSCVR